MMNPENENGMDADSKVEQRNALNHRNDGAKPVNSANESNKKSGRVMSFVFIFFCCLFCCCFVLLFFFVFFFSIVVLIYYSQGQ